MAKVEVVIEEVFKCNNVAENTLQSSFSTIVPRNVMVVNQLLKGKNKKRAIKYSHSRKNSDTLKNAPAVKKLSSKKKNKNRRTKKWKSYCKLSWIEKRELDDTNFRRVNRIREEMLQHTTSVLLPLAPYNTTQFLMDDHYTQEPDYSIRYRDNSVDEFYSCPEDEEEFLQRQFVQTYEELQSERLQTMTQNELVEEYVRLEDQVEEFEKTLEEARLHKSERTTIRPAGFNVAAELEKIRVFREEIEKLTLENDILERKKEICQMRLIGRT